MASVGNKSNTPSGAGNKNNSPTGNKNNTPPDSKAAETAQYMFNKMRVSTPTKNMQPATQVPKSSTTTPATKDKMSWSEEVEAQGKGKDKEVEQEEEEEENSGDESDDDDNVEISATVPQPPAQKEVAPPSKVAPPPKPPASNKGTGSVKSKPAAQENKRAPPKKMMWVEGSNIGDSASEPEWTEEQIQAINRALHTKLPIKVVADTRRAVPDENAMYVTHDNNGAAVTRAPAFLNNINVQQYCIGMGKAKGDQKTGKTKLYSDIVMRSRNGSWMTNQWTCKNVVVEGVPRKILDRTPRNVHTSAGSNKERRVGHEFARVGLPKVHFAPIFETLKSKYPRIMQSNVSSTFGYYWVNASWGVTGNPGRFKYMVAPGQPPVVTQKLPEVMRMFDGKSSLCQATIAISTAFNGKLSGNSIIRDGDDCELSIKIHNAFHLKKVDYRSPPQSASTGFELTDDLLQESEYLVVEKTTRENVFSEFMNDDNDNNNNNNNNDDEDDDELI